MARASAGPPAPADRRDRRSRARGDLLEELRCLPGTGTPSSAKAAATRDYGGVVVPLELVTTAGTLSFFSTTTVFGTPVDVTLVGAGD